MGARYDVARFSSVHAAIPVSPTECATKRGASLRATLLIGSALRNSSGQVFNEQPRWSATPGSPGSNCPMPVHATAATTLPPMRGDLLGHDRRRSLFPAPASFDFTRSERHVCVAVSRGG